jgi:xylose dehydrogenase (NAD/NADP)
MALEATAAEVAQRDWNRDLTGDPLSIAVIGLGAFSAEYVLPAIGESDFCKLGALVTGSPEKGERLAAAYNVDHVLSYEAFHEGGSADIYDAVYVSTPNACHLEYAKSAAAQEKHVIVEKPMEASVARAEQMVVACEDAGVVLMVGYRMHTAPTVRRAKDLIQQGAIGDPVRVETAFTFPILAFTPDTDQWRLNPELAGGGALLDAGVYTITTSRYLLGEDPIAVQGQTASVTDPFADVDEHVSFQLVFDGGATAACHASFNETLTNQVTVRGTEGSIEIDPLYLVDVDRELSLSSAHGNVEVSGLSTNEVVEQFDYFATCALSDIEPEPSGRWGLADMRIIKSIYESAESGRRVDL